MCIRDRDTSSADTREEFLPLDPQEVGIEEQREAESAEFLVQGTLEQQTRLDATVQSLDSDARGAIRASNRAKLEAPPTAPSQLSGPRDAAQAAADAVQVTLEDPARALQSQALLSVETALRVLRD